MDWTVVNQWLALGHKLCSPNWLAKNCTCLNELYVCMSAWYPDREGHCLKLEVRRAPPIMSLSFFFFFFRGGAWETLHYTLQCADQTCLRVILIFSERKFQTERVLLSVTVARATTMRENRTARMKWGFHKDQGNGHTTVQRISVPAGLFLQTSSHFHVTLSCM